jgi:hypothetical protein
MRRLPRLRTRDYRWRKCSAGRGKTGSHAKPNSPTKTLSVEEQQRRARERWLEYQQSKGAEGESSREPERDRGQGQELEKSSDGGIDDDLSL